jgi:sulfate adenylyltransferase subunit 2
MAIFRDKVASELALDLVVYINEDGVKNKINPFDHGAHYTRVMKTEALKKALSSLACDMAIGGARRDEEKSRSKERFFSIRNDQHAWDPKNQRPEIWKNYNTLLTPGESFRVFPLSNWTELDIWLYIEQENIPVVPLYFAAPRPIVNRDDQIIMVDDDRMPLMQGEIPVTKEVRFRTLGCYPLTAGISSFARTIAEIIHELKNTSFSERAGRLIDRESESSMEQKKREGYF